MSHDWANLWQGSIWSKLSDSYTLFCSPTVLICFVMNDHDSSGQQLFAFCKLYVFLIMYIKDAKDTQLQLNSLLNYNYMEQCTAPGLNSYNTNCMIKPLLTITHLLQS